MVIAQVIEDPEELERLANSLQQFIDSLDDSVGNANCACASPCDAWWVEKQARFEEDYNSLVQQLRQSTTKEGKFKGIKKPNRAVLVNRMSNASI